MRVVSEATEKKQHVLIVDSRPTRLSRLLRLELKKSSNEVYFSPQVPPTVDKFDYLFLVNNGEALKKIRPALKQKTVFIFIGQQSQAASLLKTANQRGLDLKIISCSYDQLNQQELDKLLWFALSTSGEKFLSFEGLKRNIRKPRTEPIDWSKIFTPRRLIIVGVSLLFAVHLLMLPFIAVSSYFHYRSATALKDNKLSEARRLLSTARTTYSLANTLYQPVRPTYLFFSLAPYPDNIFAVNEKTGDVIDNSLTMSENANQIFQLILKKSKSEEERTTLDVRLNKMTNDLNRLEDDLINLNQRLPDKPNQLKELKSQLGEAAALVTKGKRIFPHLPNLLAKNGQKKYLLMFANNMELRPGGGFIGSYGILTLKDMTLESIEVYDVYDADGQLTIHIDPPEAIRQYLQQPHWFLRDSAFSADFFENYNQARFFLREELGLTDFSGGILLTTTAIQNVLESYGSIYLPDFNEEVNKQNFYIKAQLYAEKGFFPGSIQKKNFLGDLTKQILLNLDGVSAPQLLRQIEKSLDEKQMTVIVDDDNAQRIIDSFYWAGKAITPQCTDNKPSCVIDYIFPVDANLGVNKANFFIRHSMSQKIAIADDGTVRNSFVIKLQNDSANDVFPGGPYKNYFQIHLPADSLIDEVTRDGTLIEEVDLREGEFKTIGFFFELAPQKSTEIEINYRLGQKITKGQTTYQLIWQKQIGSKNSDVTLEISLPDNVSLLRQNFTPLVKDNRIFYNTSLDTDKIFLIELNK